LYALSPGAPDKRFEEPPIFIFDPEDGGGRYFRNSGVRGRAFWKTVIATVVAAINSKLASVEAKFCRGHLAEWHFCVNVLIGIHI
jgi:hypothetical protein